MIEERERDLLGEGKRFEVHLGARRGAGGVDVLHKERRKTTVVLQDIHIIVIVFRMRRVCVYF